MALKRRKAVSAKSLWSFSTNIQLEDARGITNTCAFDCIYYRYLFLHFCFTSSHTASLQKPCICCFNVHVRCSPSHHALFHICVGSGKQIIFMCRHLYTSDPRTCNMESTKTKCTYGRALEPSASGKSVPTKAPHLFQHPTWGREDVTQQTLPGYQWKTTSMCSWGLSRTMFLL